MVDVGTVINGIEITEIGRKFTDKSVIWVATCKCQNCGKEFNRALNTVKHGTLKCTCQGGYRDRE